MSETEQRLLAAGDLFEVEETENGKPVKREYRLRPVTAQHLCDLERDALREWKREYLAVLKDVVDTGEFRAEAEKVAGWDVSSLPQKDAYDVRAVEVTDELRTWLAKEYSVDVTEDKAARALTLHALDSGKLDPAMLRELAGGGLIRGRIRWDQWWVTSTINGMISFITTSLKADHPDVTRERVGSWPLPKLAEAARIVERITSARMGNT